VIPRSRVLLLQTAAPLIAIAIVLVVCRVRGLPLRSTLALRLPPASTAVVWVCVFGVLIVLEEWVSRRLLHMTVEPWDADRLTLPLVIRLVTMIVLAPLGEELVFRGLMFDQLSRGQLGTTGAVIVGAAVFALLHGQYAFTALALIFVDGLCFGFARASSNSVLLPIGLHAIGNALAAAQRLRLTAW
jgi:membrane protease YdiL (CAAX protease family)